MQTGYIWAFKSWSFNKTIFGSVYTFENLYTLKRQCKIVSDGSRGLGSDGKNKNSKIAEKTWLRV